MCAEAAKRVPIREKEPAVRSRMDHETLAVDSAAGRRRNPRI